MPDQDITVDLLLELGYVKESRSGGVLELRFQLSDLYGTRGEGVEWTHTGSHNRAEEDLANKLDEYIKGLSKSDREEILDMKRIKEGGKQDKIKIQKFGEEPVRYMARYLVRGEFGYIDYSEAEVEEQGEHFVVTSSNTRKHPYAEDANERSHGGRKKTEVYHDRDKAHEIAVRRITELVKTGMSVHQMEEAGSVHFLVVEKRHNQPDVEKPV